MRPINVELTMGHALGLSESYYKPTEKEVLEDYLKAVEILTINDSKLVIQKQVVEQTEINKEENYIIKGMLAEKEKVIEAAAREAEQQKKRMDDMQKEIDKIREIMDSFAPSEGMDRLFDDEERERERRHAGQQRAPSR
jgi:hypothetical protein